jgi:hypothetical protein
MIFLYRNRVNILVTQPRKIAARSSAKRVCEERGWCLGGPVGYQVPEYMIQSNIKILHQGLMFSLGTWQAIRYPICTTGGWSVMIQTNIKVSHRCRMFSLRNEWSGPVPGFRQAGYERGSWLITVDTGMLLNIRWDLAVQQDGVR